MTEEVAKIGAAGLQHGSDYAVRKLWRLLKIGFVFPLKDRQEAVYVLPGSPAEARAAANPAKEVRRVGLSVERKP